MPRPRLGLIMIVKDEAANLAKSLQPVAREFDEAVVVDTGSVDDTPELAASMGALVFHAPWRDDFAWARNQSIANARAEWLFWLDADNSITPADVAALRRCLPAEGPAVLWAMEKVVPSGEMLWQKRCFPNLPQVYFSGRVHEQLIHPQNWPGLITPVKISHWGYRDAGLVAEKGAYYQSLLEETLKEDPRDYYAHFQIARCHMNARQFVEAEKHLKAMLADARARAGNLELWVHGHELLSRALRRQGLVSEAVRVLDDLIHAAPKHGLAHFHRGRLACLMEDWPRGVEHLSRALQLGLLAPVVDLDPEKTLFHAFYYLGRARREMGQGWASAAAFNEAANLAPENPAVLCDLAQVLMELDEKEEAREKLEQALKVRSGYRRAQELLESLEGMA